MRVAEFLTRKVEVELGGLQWRLVVTHKVLLDFEAVTGVDSLGAVNLWSPSAVVVRGLLWALLRAAGAGWDLLQVGGLINGDQLFWIMRQLRTCWAVSMPEPESGTGSPGARFTWLNAWASATQELTISDEQWLAMTPRMIKARRKVRAGQMERDAELLGVIAATTANFGFCKPKKPFTARSIMGLPERVEVDPNEYAGARLLRLLDALPHGAVVEGKHEIH